MTKAIELAKLCLLIVVVLALAASFFPTSLQPETVRVETVGVRIFRIVDVLNGAVCYYIPPFALSCATPGRVG